MDASGTFFNIFRTVIQQLPSLLAAVGCIVAAIVLWKRHPKVSLTVIIGMVLILLHALTFAITYAMLPIVMRSTGSYEQMQKIYTAVSFLSSSSLAVCLAVLLVAVFMNRSKAA